MPDYEGAADFVNAIADLKAESGICHTAYRKTIIAVNDEIREYDDPSEPKPTVLKLATLSAVAAYVNKGLHGLGEGTPVSIAVQGPTKVIVTAPVVGQVRDQLVFVEANPSAPEYSFGQFMVVAEMIVMLQSRFLVNEERNNLLKTIAKIKSSETEEINDDGVSQSVTASASLTRSGGEMRIGEPVMLTPFRTFPEVVQPSSPFVLRMRKVQDGTTQAALFEADGGAWRNLAILAIGEWLKSNVEESDSLVVLA